MKKKLLALLLVFTMLLPVGIVSANNLYPDSSIDVFLHGERLEFEIDPIQTDGTTFVQFTTIFKALGLQYEWLPATKEVHGYNATTDIWLTLNDKIVLLDGEIKELLVAPFAYNGRTLVPLRFVSEATGLEVNWDGPNRQIDIYTKGNKPAAPTAKTVSVSDLVFGYEKGDSQNDVIAYMKPYTHVEKNEYSIKYDYMSLYGYDAPIYFNFIANKLTGVSYYYGRYNEDTNMLADYYDIMSSLESVYGKPKTYDIYETWEEGVEPAKVDADIPHQLLMQGLEDGDYEILASWEFANVYINANLYQTDSYGMNVDVTVSFK